MNRLENKNIVITGGSAGIGRALAEKCAASKSNLIILARRIERLTTLKMELESIYGISVMVFQVNVSDREAVQKFAGELKSASIHPDVLINNAGIDLGSDRFHKGNFEDWDHMINTNIMGLLNISRTIIPMMVEKNRGHIVNIGSLASHQVYPTGNVYNATKFAVRALTEAMNIDLVGTNIRISSVSPGLVRTDLRYTKFKNETEKIEKAYAGVKELTPEDVAESIFFIINAPEHVNVLEMIVLPTVQRNAYCLHRERK